MKKKMICFILSAALLLSLLSGCNLQMTMLPQNTKPASTKPSEPTDTTEATDPTQATRPVRPTEATAPTEETEPPYVPLPTAPSLPTQPSEDPIGPGINPEDKPNVENGVYASCGNYYYTMYLDWNKETIQFYLLTEKPLPEDRKIVTNLQTNHWAYIVECEVPNMSMDSRMFADWKGAAIDWAMYWQLEKAYFDALFDYKAGKINYDTLLAAYNAQLAYYAKTKEYQPAYQQVVQEWKDGKQFFHVYEVTIYLSKYKVDEELTEVELMAGDMSRAIPVGCIRLREKQDPSTKEINELTMHNLRFSLISRSKTDTLTFPWTSGVQEMTWAFTALRDMTLTDAYFFANGGEGCNIVGAEVQLTLTDGNHKEIGKPRVVTWTPGTPLEVKKNEMVECWVYYEDPRTQMAEYGAKHYMVLEYTCEGTTCKALSSSEKSLRKWNSTYLQYFWAFTDYDFMAFYEEYIWLRNQYMEEINYNLPDMPNPPVG